MAIRSLAGGKAGGETGEKRKAAKVDNARTPARTRLGWGERHTARCSGLGLLEWVEYGGGRARPRIGMAHPFKFSGDGGWWAGGVR